VLVSLPWHTSLACPSSSPSSRSGDEAPVCVLPGAAGRRPPGPARWAGAPERPQRPRRAAHLESGATPGLPRPGAGRPALCGMAAAGHHRHAPRGGRRAALGRRRPGRRARLAPPTPGGHQLRGGRLRAKDRQGPALAGAGPGDGGRATGASNSAASAAAGGRPALAGVGAGVHLAGRPPPSTRSASPGGSSSTPGRPACPRSGCTTSATATRPPPSPPACPPRSSASGSGTPTSPSPWTPTATCCPARTPRPPARSPG
jgi:hypothetical protein